MRVISLTLLMLSACGGGTGSRTLSGFEHSECKSREPGQAARATPRSLRAALPDSEELDGLSCVRATRSDGALHVTYVNLAESCGAASAFRARVAGSDADSVVLVLACPERLPTRCGTCAFDVRYDLTILDSAEIETVSLQNECSPGSSVLRTELSADAETLACEYSSSGLELFAHEGGSLRRRCREATAAEAACDDGLRCTEVAEQDTRCLATCTANDECALPGLEACTDGVCRLR